MRKTVVLGIFALAVIGMPSSAQERSLAAVEFEWNCALCHGEDGKGTSLFEHRSEISMPDLTTLAKRHGGEFPTDYVKKVIAGSKDHAWHEPGNMPAWGLYYSVENYLGSSTGIEDWRAEYVEEKIAAMVTYLKGLQVE